jgi:uncharacterized protein (DUF1697 family)
MPTFTALLRGVNVGKARRVPMAEFRSLLIDLGYTNVSTLLNSGNAVFCSGRNGSARHASAIGAALLARLGVETAVIVKSAKELGAIIDGNPVSVPVADHPRLLVAFAAGANALAELAAVGRLATDPERFVLGRNAAYLFCANGILESKAAAALLGKSGRSATTRNWATVLKLQALARACAGGERPAAPART